ncbi:MAG: helicase-associated domain-containing protein [Pseudonocardia sp.]
MHGTSLLDWLRARDDASLATLLRLRPDLGVPPPADLAVLATRVGIRASVNRACEDLDTVTLAVLEALLVAGANTEPVPEATLETLLGPELTAFRLPAALAALRDRALVWDATDLDAGPALRVVPAANEVTSRYPGGLGRSSAALTDRAVLDELLADTPPEQRRVLDALADGPPIGRSRAPATGPPTPVQRLVSRGLLLRVDPETVELPREVGLALRGPAPLSRLAVEEPTLATHHHGRERIDATAAGAVLELLRGVETLIKSWSAAPPAVLRSGGLGVRELRKLARELGLEPSEVALLVEVVVAAGLVAGSESASAAEWVPTTSADLWLAGGPEQRWVPLARAWLELPRLPGLVGMRDDSDKVLAPLSDELRRPLAPRDRRRALDLLATLPPGHAVRGPAELAATLAWRAPRRGGRMRDELVAWTLAEATLLGVVALGGLAEHGRVLLASGPSDAAPVIEALRAALPEPVDQVLLQADLTAIAPGRLRADVAEELALVADVESAGGATVYRITESSIRRALDTGRPAAELHALFAQRSATPVPQGLSYLIDDVARRHGRLRGGSARSFLRADDEVLLAEVLAHPAAESFELRRIAPTVLVSELALAQLLEALRRAGFAPVAEAGDGTGVDLRPAGRRIPARPRPPVRAALPVPGEAQVTALVAAIRAGDRAAALRPRTLQPASTNGLDTVELLRDAARQRRSVWIGYINSLGVASRRIVEPVSVGGGVLEGYDRAQGDLRRFMLHRITSAAVLDASAGSE